MLPSPIVRYMVGNPVEGERDFGVKPNTIPLWFRTAKRNPPREENDEKKE